ncbi:hypothetical protein ES703_34898 [subsurface metagenome]
MMGVARKIIIIVVILIGIIVIAIAVVLPWVFDALDLRFVDAISLVDQSVCLTATAPINVWAL